MMILVYLWNVSLLKNNEKKGILEKYDEYNIKTFQTQPLMGLKNL